ncbi:hypothetical protein CDAR_76711 [Caerostris darwini]|uniref:Uncharacterized protein n=1 Tax=Caerostris darwini TaxID=1538125 RepID=A0AAV4QAW7_9ARAC|nr:hypothetical protein CDAR_76711 [Caerostris darwini]
MQFNGKQADGALATFNFPTRRRLSVQRAQTIDFRSDFRFPSPGLIRKNPFLRFLLSSPARIFISSAFPPSSSNFFCFFLVHPSSFFLSPLPSSLPSLVERGFCLRSSNQLSLFGLRAIVFQNQDN